MNKKVMNKEIKLVFNVVTFLSVYIYISLKLATENIFHRLVHTLALLPLHLVFRFTRSYLLVFNWSGQRWSFKYLFIWWQLQSSSTAVVTMPVTVSDNISELDSLLADLSSVRYNQGEYNNNANAVAGSIQSNNQQNLPSRSANNA